jgi:hypothetical protein
MAPFARLTQNVLCHASWVCVSFLSRPAWRGPVYRFLAGRSGVAWVSFLSRSVWRGLGLVLEPAGVGSGVRARRFAVPALPSLPALSTRFAAAAELRASRAHWTLESAPVRQPRQCLRAPRLHRGASEIALTPLSLASLTEGEDGPSWAEPRRRTSCASSHEPIVMRLSSYKEDEKMVIDQKRKGATWAPLRGLP